MGRDFSLRARPLGRLVAVSVLGLWPTGAGALSINATLLCGVYPEAPACASGRAPCAVCHEGGPPALNPFGADVRAEIATRPGYAATPDDFQRHLPDVLRIVEARDSDGDGAANGDELRRGHAPGNATDRPGDDDPGAYDAALALERVHALYCGGSPTYDQARALRNAPDAGKHAVLHAALDSCLASRFWLDEALPRLADERIRPVGTLGPVGNPFILGDYTYDYRLFVHALSGGRDARDLLTADYHVRPDGTVTRDAIPDHEVPGRFVLGNGQPLAASRRAGLMTTQWFIGFNTMFALLPRGSAAQAYRAYLGLDIARSEGLHPIAGEPRDVDGMGVGAPDCAVCHSTLDPLAYAFSPYVALSRTRPDGSTRPRGFALGTYDPGATTWEGLGYLLGQPVDDLLDWARKAAASEEFKTALALTFYRHALGREPETPRERAELAALAAALPADGYSADALIHRLVDTTSFGAPGRAAAPTVVWKRHKTLGHDLARALELPPAEVCREFGLFSCTDDVFLSPLGGNDPFEKSQYRPMRAPTAITPVALDRVALSACARRAADDEAAATPRVFRHLDLRRPVSAAAPAAVDQQLVDLYQRFHGRDPSARELAALRALAQDDQGAPVAALDFVKLACFVVATSMEFAFD